VRKRTGLKSRLMRPLCCLCVSYLNFGNGWLILIKFIRRFMPPLGFSGTSCVTQSSVFWDMTSCCLFKVNLCFGGICCVHLQYRRISKAKKSAWSG
jgi:hypothetical protein